MSSLRAVNGPVNAQPRAARCVVLAQRQGAAPALLAGLTRRGMAASVVSDVPGVMVDLARGRARAVILAVEPSTPRLEELLDAVRTYYPQTGCWAYRCEPGSEVGRLIRVESARAETPPSPPPPLEPAADPSVARDSDSDSDPGSDVDNDPLVSHEEMAMLLGRGDDDDEQQWGR